MIVSYCVVVTEGRALLERGLAAIAAERAVFGEAETEVLVLDNASTDGSLDVARASGARVIALNRRTGKAANDSTLLRQAGGEFALLLNEDSALCPGATRALVDALRAHPRAAAAGARLIRPDGTEQPSAFRFPTPAAAARFAFGLTARNVQSGRGLETVEVDWAHSAALLVRRGAAERVGWLDPAFFVYSDEVDFARRLADAGFTSLHVPAAVAVHDEQLSTGAGAQRRIVEFHRNRDRYVRKHATAGAARAVRWLTALGYAERAVAAAVLPGRDARRMAAHARAALAPGRGEGIAEAAAAFNRERDRDGAGAAPGSPPAPAA